MAEVNFKKLQEAVKALNGTDMLEANIKTVGLSKDKMLSSFIAAIDGLDEDDAKALPKKVKTFYNSLPEDVFEDEDAAEEEEVEEADDDEDEVEDDDDDEVEDEVEEADDDEVGEEEEEEAPAPKAKAKAKKEPKAKAAKKEKAPAKPKAPKKPAAEKSVFGHNGGSMAATVDELLTQKGGVTEAEAIKVIMKRHGRNEAKAKNAFNCHCNYLPKAKGVEVKFNEKKETYSAAKA